MLAVAVAFYLLISAIFFAYSQKPIDLFPNSGVCFGACFLSWVALRLPTNAHHWAIIAKHVDLLMAVAVVCCPFVTEATLQAYARPNKTNVMVVVWGAFTLAAWLATERRGFIAALGCAQFILWSELYLDFAFFRVKEHHAVSCALGILAVVLHMHQQRSTNKQSKIAEHAYCIGFIAFGTLFCSLVLMTSDFFARFGDPFNKDPVTEQQQDRPEIPYSLFAFCVFNFALLIFCGVLARRKLWILVGCVGVLIIAHMLLFAAWPDYPLADYNPSAAYIEGLRTEWMWRKRFAATMAEHRCTAWCECETLPLHWETPCLKHKLA